MHTKVFKMFNRYKALVILIVLLIFMAMVKPVLFSGANLRNLFLKVSIQGIIGFGMTFVLIAGEFDMSVGSILTLSGIVFASMLSRFNLGVAVLAAIAVGIITGFINGTMISRMKLSSFIATLGAQYIYKAIALMISKGNPIRVTDPIVIAISDFRFAGNTIFPFLFLLTGVFSLYILSRTRLGRNLYAVGGNAETAANSGINVKKYKTIAFILVCLSSAFAGVLMTTRLQSATTIAGDDTSLTVISSVIIGGTSPAGGVGGAIESFIGLIIIAIITTSLDILNISGYYQQVAQGLMTVIIIGSTSFANYRKVTTA